MAEQTQQSPTESAPLQAPEDMPAETPKKSKKTLVLASALIVIVLGVVAYLVFGNNKSTSNTTTTTQPPAAPATTTDVDQTTKAIDTAIKQADNAGDVSSSDLNDNTLGL